MSLSVDALKSRFKHATVTATIECAGNRRAEMKAIPCPGSSGATIKGLDWEAGAIGTAEGGGVWLRDVLLDAGGWGGDWGGGLGRKWGRSGECVLKLQASCAGASALGDPDVRAGERTAFGC